MQLSRDILPKLREVTLERLEQRQLLAFGQLDTDFGTDGQVATPVSVIDVNGFALRDLEVLDGDGTIVAGGSGGFVQWTRDGEIDADFGVGGTVTFPDVTYRDHEVSSDGKVYLLGSGAEGGVVLRFTDAGQLDESFGTAGSTMISFGHRFTPTAIALQDDGKVVVAGSVSTNMGRGARTRLYRLEPDGAPDLGFGFGSSMDLQLGAGDPIVTPIQRDTVTGLTILSGGRIIVAGSSLAYAPELYIDELGIFNPAVYGDSVFATARLTVDGMPDATYGAGGVSRAVYATGIAPSPATAFAHRDDDAIGVAAYTDRLVYAQFNASGVVGYNRAAEIPGFGTPLDMAPKHDGRFMLVGLAEAVTGYGLQVAYLTTTGDLSNTVQTNDASPLTIDLAESGPATIAVAHDGDILVGGRPGDGSGAYQVVKLDDGAVDAARPDQFVEARGNDIVRDQTGGVHLTFFDATNRVLKYAYRGPNGLWDSTVVVDGAPESGHYLSIAVDGNGRPGIAYFDGIHGDLKYAFSPSNGQWATQLVEGIGITGLYPSLQFDSAQRATVAYYRKSGGELRIAAQVSEGIWSCEVVDGAANDVGRGAALVAQPLSGRWSIAYNDTTTGDVKLAWRTKARVWQIETAARTLGGADYLSLAFNPSTEPAGVYLRAAISFYDTYNADLKVTQSSGGDAALVWTDKILESRGAAGLYSYLTFDAFHGPTVYYYNRNGDRVTRLTDRYPDGLTGETLVQGGGRFLSIFSDGTTVDVAYFDDDEGVLKVQSMPLRV